MVLMIPVKKEVAIDSQTEEEPQLEMDVKDDAVHEVTVHEPEDLRESEDEDIMMPHMHNRMSIHITSSSGCQDSPAEGPVRPGTGERGGIQK